MASSSEVRVAAGPRGLLATGTTSVTTIDYETRTTAHVWRSDDGARWTEVRGVTGLANAEPRTLVADGDGWIAGGIDNRGGGYAIPGIWSTSDVRHWSTGTVELPPESSGYVGAVVQFEGRWVAGGAGPRVAAVWSSTDRRTWTMATDTDAFAVPGVGFYGQGGITGMVATEDGIVAIGMVGAPRPITSSMAAIFTSPDGTTWVRAALPDDAGRLSPTDIIASGGRVLVTAGPAEDAGGFGRPPVVLTSTDGSTWRAEDPVDVAGGDATFRGAITGLAAGPRGIVGVGVRVRWAGEPAPFVWLAGDGATALPDTACPTAPLTARAFATMSNVARVACLHDPVTVSGWLRFQPAECGAADATPGAPPVAFDDTFCSAMVVILPSRSAFEPIASFVVQDARVPLDLDGWGTLTFEVGGGPCEEPDLRDIVTPLSVYQAQCRAQPHLLSVRRTSGPG